MICVDRPVPDYEYSDPHTNESHGYLLPEVLRALARVGWSSGQRRVFEIGCGNGSVAHALSREGYEVVGVDASTSGIAEAKRAFPELSLFVGSAYDPLATRYGRFGAVLSLEVIEHLYAPREFVRCAFDLLAPGGTLILSTPYHGYLKNLALAVCGAMDRHFTALWDGGHIKFFSMRTLSSLLSEAGFINVQYARVGRIPPLAKSMVATAQKPQRTA